MAARARNTLDSAAAPVARVSGRPRMASGAEGAAPSPALMLQQALTAELNDAERDPSGKWPPAATAAFVVVTCGAFWAAVGLALSRAFG